MANDGAPARGEFAVEQNFGTCVNIKYGEGGEAIFGLVTVRRGIAKNQPIPLYTPGGPTRERGSRRVVVRHETHVQRTRAVVGVKTPVQGVFERALQRDSDAKRNRLLLGVVKKRGDIKVRFLRFLGVLSIVRCGRRRIQARRSRKSLGLVPFREGGRQD